MAALFYYTNYYDLVWQMDPDKVIPFGICWSLAIEEHFYLGWPLILRRNIQNPQRLCLIVVALCLGVLIWRLVARHALSLPTEHTYMATDCRIDAILYGALLRVLFETRWRLVVGRILHARWCRILAALLLLAMFVVRDDDFRETFRYSIQGIALMPLFAAVLSDHPRTLVRRVLASGPMVLIGRLSYSIYLFHLMARTPGEVYFGSPAQIGSIISGLAYHLCHCVRVVRPCRTADRRTSSPLWSQAEFSSLGDEDRGSDGSTEDRAASGAKLKSLRLG